jgi:hypothetical protein
MLNIQADDERNYFVFMLGCEDEEDGIMIGFGLSYYEEFSAYLHLPPRYLKELIKKYALVSKATDVQKLTIEEFLIEQAKDRPMN